MTVKVFQTLSSYEGVLKKVAQLVLYGVPFLLAATRAGADIGVGMIVLFFLLRSGISRQWGWAREREVSLLLVLWVFMLGMSAFTPFDPKHSFTAALIWGRFIFFYAAARYWLLDSPQAVKNAGLFAMATVVCATIDAAWQYQTGVSLSGRPILVRRLTGPISTPSIGNFLLKTGLPALGIVLYLPGIREKQWKRWLVVACALAAIAIITVSGERSSGLLMLLGIAVACGILFIVQPRLRRWVMACFVGIGLLMAVLSATPVVQDREHAFVQQLSDFRHTPYGQLYIGALRLAWLHPLTGIGAQQYWDVCRAQQEAIQVTYCDIHPHNMYLEWLVAGGVVGFALFMAAISIMVRKLLRDISFEGPAAILAAFACAEMAVVLFPLIITQSQFSNWPAILFWYSLSMAVCLPLLAKPTDKYI